MRADLSFASPELELEFFELHTEHSSWLVTQVTRQRPREGTHPPRHAALRASLHA